jgi:RNA polymerase sigma-70 factor, ECF subfamily
MAEWESDNAGVEDLVRRAQAGDEAAFTLLYDQYITPIYRYISFRIRNRSDVEDLTQQTFLKAWQNLHRYTQQGEGRFLPWLYTIARNNVFDFAKKKHEILPDEPEAVFNIEDNSIPNPEEAASANERVRELERLLSTLNEEQQRVLVERFIEGRSNTEIAKNLGKKEAAVRQLQSRAIRLLRKKRGEIK